ncbi:hypothetical protein GGX14DRAFT_560817 [Mycena pura]|uniref:Myb/SANT-like domain-containing protein n=1 Tax=Mycena pura TaxID=153505 RepID=A0AAD6VSA2_9AGAR|nr:hypothetical protein GGX14DRAFT_560817 [Mycena pura]
MATNAKTDTADASDNELDTIADATAKFTQAETDYVLDYVLERRADLMSGNGFKSKAYGQNERQLPQQAELCMYASLLLIHLTRRQVKTLFAKYEFVRGRSGVGWDDGAKHATAEAVFIEAFLQVRAWKAICSMLTTTCPAYDRCVMLFGGNKATGDHVFHPKSKKCSRAKPAQDSPTPSKANSPRKPLAPLVNDTIDLDSDSALDEHTAINSFASSASRAPRPYDDELLPSPAKRARTSTDATPTDGDEKNTSAAHTRSRSGGSGGRRSRTAETGSEIASGLKTIGAGMSAPLITKADTSHVDEVINVLVTDESILPHDPDGELYAGILELLSSNETRSRAFVKTKSRIHRIALLKRFLNEAKIPFPENWM